MQSIFGVTIHRFDGFLANIEYGGGLRKASGWTRTRYSLVYGVLLSSRLGGTRIVGDRTRGIFGLNVPTIRDAEELGKVQVTDGEGIVVEEGKRVCVF